MSVADEKYNYRFYDEQDSTDRLMNQVHGFWCDKYNKWLFTYLGINCEHMDLEHCTLDLDKTYNDMRQMQLQ
jgi:hypothetical protein